MDTQLLENSPVGNLVRVTGFDLRFNEDYQVMSFLPEPLPCEVSLRGATHKIIADAASWVGRADQAVGQLPNPGLLVRPTIRREAVDTSALEGTFAAFTDVLEADFLGDDELTKSVSEVKNFVQAAEAALRWVGDGRPISSHLIESLQKILVRGTQADNGEAGHIRTTQVPSMTAMGVSDG
jgi:Fic family protein